MNTENILFLTKIYNGDYHQLDRLIHLEEKINQLKFIEKELVTTQTARAVLTLLGSPRAGKTESLKIVAEYLRKNDYSVSLLEEPANTITKDCSIEEKMSLLSNRLKFIEKQFEKGLEEYESLPKENDFILIDRGFLDPFIWLSMSLENEQIKNSDYKSTLEKWYEKLSRLPKEDCFIVMSLITSIIESLKRDYLNSLWLQPRTTINSDTLFQYQSTLLSQEIQEMLKKISYQNVVLDTTALTIQNTAAKVVEELIDTKLTLIKRRIRSGN